MLAAPTSVSTSSYTGVVGSIDEWYWSGSDRLIGSSPTSLGTLSGEVFINASGSPSYQRPYQLLVAHTGTATGGWRLSIQFKVNGVNIGTPVSRDRVGNANNAKVSAFQFPASAAMASTPHLASFAWTATNLHTGSQQHHIHAIALCVSPHSSQPVIAGVNYNNLEGLWLPHLSAPAEGWDHNDPVRMVPDLKSGAHMFTATNDDPLYKTDDDELDHAVAFAAGRLAVCFDKDVTDPGFTSGTLVSFFRTPLTMPTADSNSQAAVAGFSDAAIGSGLTFGHVFAALAAASDGGGSWITMMAQTGAESDHLRASIVDASAPDTWVSHAVRFDGSANEKVYVHDQDGDPLELDDLIIDDEGTSPTSTVYTFGVGCRSDGTRAFQGKWCGSAWVKGSVSAQATLDIANSIAQSIGLMGSTSSGATATLNIDGQGDGTATEEELGPDPDPPTGPKWDIILRAKLLNPPDDPPTQAVSVPYHFTLSTGYGWISADRDGYRVAYGFLRDTDEVTQVVKYIFVGGYAEPGELYDAVVFDQGGTDWTRFLWDGRVWDPVTQGHEANDAPQFEIFAQQARPDERPVIRMVETATSEVVELRNYGALVLGAGVEINQLQHITTPFLDPGARGDSADHIVYERIQLGLYINGSRIHGIYYDVVNPNYHMTSTLDEPSPEQNSGGVTASLTIDGHADQAPGEPPPDDPPPPTGANYLVRPRVSPLGTPISAWDDRYYRLHFGGGGWTEGDLDSFRVSYEFLDVGDGPTVGEGTLIGRVTTIGGFAVASSITKSGSDLTHFLFDGTPWDPGTQGAEANDAPPSDEVYTQTRPDERPVVRFLHTATNTVLEVRNYQLVPTPDPLWAFQQMAHITTPFEAVGGREDSVPHDVFDRVTIAGFYDGDLAYVVHFDILDPAYRLTSTHDPSLVTSAGATAELSSDALADEPVEDGTEAELELGGEAAGFANAYWDGATATLAVEGEANGSATEQPNDGVEATLAVGGEAEGAAHHFDGATALLETAALATGETDYFGPYAGSMRVIPDFVAPLDVE